MKAGKPAASDMMTDNLPNADSPDHGMSFTCFCFLIRSKITKPSKDTNNDSSMCMFCMYYRQTRNVGLFLAVWSLRLTVVEIEIEDSQKTAVRDQEVCLAGLNTANLMLRDLCDYDMWCRM